MKKQSLLYSLVGLIATGTFSGLLLSNYTNAQSSQNSNNPHHTPTSSPGNCSAMGMMNQEQKDQHFIVMMIPHHQGAIEMADLALNKSKRPEIRQMAQEIKQAQTREIEQMKNWYKQWYGTEIPSDTSMGMSGHSGQCAMMNMTTHLDALKNASDFDQVFVEQMIPHHEGAVMMSSMVLNSDRPELRNLANNVIQTQTREIEQMRQWLDSW